MAGVKANHLSLRIVRVSGVPCGTPCTISYSVAGCDEDEKEESAEVMANDRGEVPFNWDLSPIQVGTGKNALKMRIMYGPKEVQMMVGLEKFIKAEKKAKCKFDSKDKSVSVVISGRSAVPPPSFWETLMGTKESATADEVITALQGHTQFTEAIQEACSLQSTDPKTWQHLRALLLESFGDTIEKGNFTLSSLVAYIKKNIARQRARALTIIVQAEDGSAHPLDVHPTMLLGGVMEKCDAELRLKTEDMVFTHGGRQLTDFSVSIEDAGIAEGDVLGLKYYVEDVEKAWNLVSALKVEMAAQSYQNKTLKEAVEMKRQMLAELQEEVDACRTQLQQESVTADGVTNVNMLLHEIEYETSRRDIEYAEEMLLIDLESKKDELRHRATQNTNLREHLAYLNESVNECLVPWKGMKEELNNIENQVEAIDEILGIERYVIEVTKDGYIGMELGETSDGVISVLTVDPNSPAADAGMTEGGVLYTYDSKRVKTLEELESAMDAFAFKDTQQLVIETGAPTAEEYQRVLATYGDTNATDGGKGCHIM